MPRKTKKLNGNSKDPVTKGEFNDAMGVIKKSFDMVNNDISGLKSDVFELKSDVTGLKSDVTGLKSDVTELKSDVSELKSDVSGLKSETESLKNTTQLTLEIVQQIDKNQKADSKWKERTDQRLKSLEKDMFQIKFKNR